LRRCGRRFRFVVIGAFGIARTLVNACSRPWPVGAFGMMARGGECFVNDRAYFVD
jgi:hypothetical protein